MQIVFEKQFLRGPQTVSDERNSLFPQKQKRLAETDKDAEIQKGKGRPCQRKHQSRAEEDRKGSKLAWLEEE